MCLGPRLHGSGGALSSLQLHTNHHHHPPVSFLRSPKLTSIEVTLPPGVAAPPAFLQELPKTLQHLGITAKTDIYTPDVPFWFLACVPKNLEGLKSVALIVDNKWAYKHFVREVLPTIVSIASLLNPSIANSGSL